MATRKPRAALTAFLVDAMVVWKPRRLSRRGKVVLSLAAAYAAIDVAAALTLPRLLWADSGWPLLHPRWVWHPFEAALYVADGKFLMLYEAPAVGDPAGYYYMPLGPVLFSVPAAIGDALGSVGALLVMMVGWGAFWAAAAVALGAYRLAGFRGAVVALAAAKATTFGWANLDLLVAGLLVLGVSTTEAGQRGAWTGAALLTKQIAGPLALPLLVSRMRSRLFLAAAVAAPVAVVSAMVVAAPRATLEAVSARRNATSWQRTGLCDECSRVVPFNLEAVSLTQSWVLWVVVAFLVSWRLRDRVRCDERALLAAVTVIAVLRPLIGVATVGAEPHHWTVAVVCAAVLAETNRRDGTGPRRRVGGWGVVAAAVVLRYWYQDYGVLPSDWWALDPFPERWGPAISPTYQAVGWLAVVVPCAAVFAWPALAVLLGPKTSQNTDTVGALR